MLLGFFDVFMQKKSSVIKDILEKRATFKASYCMFCGKT